MIRALAFLGGARPIDYGLRFARLRWRRAARPARVADWDPAASARAALSGADEWVVVHEAADLPLGSIPDAPAGRILASSAAPPPPVHTYRELAAMPIGGIDAAAGRAPSMIAFRCADLPPAEDETIGEWVDGLPRRGLPVIRPTGFAAVRLEVRSNRERPELTRRLPSGRLRILDVGCGAGAAIADGKAGHPDWVVTGIERDLGLAAAARSRCDRLVEGDLNDALPELIASGERFDAIVLGDVLEHLEDPFRALALCRSLATPGTRLLVSVPNAGHLSVVRDLLMGRFDPVPAGLCDAGHVRWFTRASLAEALEATRWRADRISGEPGAPPPDADALRTLAAAWPGADAESLDVYQWIAEAVAE